MYIEDRDEPFPCIVIRNDKDNFKIKGTTLRVHEPASIDQSSKSRIDKSMHIPNWSEEATREVIDPRSGSSSRSRVLLLRSSLHEKAKPVDFILPHRRFSFKGSSWKIPPSNFGEVSFHVGFWEWTEDVLSHYEDTLRQAKIYAAVHASLFTYVCNKKVLRAFLELWCPSTNTLHAANGELSISLWDIRGLCGLPIHGDFYDEVVPSAKELLNNDSRGTSLPRSCKYLFMAYHRLSKDSSGVLLSDWIDFWFKGPTRYSEPPLRLSRKRTSRPKLSRNPCGKVDASKLSRPKEYDTPFATLKVEEDIKEETYLAAFIACWLCSFALPHGSIDKIRASVFKVSSRMARGEYFSLAVPILAGIYRGLRGISTSENLDESPIIFPIHYLYAWIRHTFETHFHSKLEIIGAHMVKYAGENMAKHFDLDEARDLFHNINMSKLRDLWYSKQEILVTDDAKLSSKCKDILVALRSSYLTFRCEAEHIIEAYSPHRFSRQHGFCQSIPDDLNKEILTCELHELIRFWKSCTLLGTSSKLIMPSDTSSFPLVTKEYTEWWAKSWKTSLGANTKLSLKLGRTIQRASAKDPKEPYVSSSIGKENIAQVAETSTRKQRIPLDNVASDPAFEVAYGEGNEIISALLPSNDESSNQCPSKETSKLPDFEEDVRLTSQISLGSVNEANFLGLHETGATSRPQDKRQKTTSLVVERIFTEQQKTVSPVPAIEKAYVEVSEFSPQIIKSEAERVLLNFYWQRISQKNRNTSFQQPSEVKPAIEKVLKDMQAYMQDISPLEKRLKSYFEDVSQYTQVKSDFTQRETQEMHDKSLLLAQRDLSEAELQESELVETANNVKAEILEITKELEELRNKKESASSSLGKVEEDLAKMQQVVAMKRENISRLGNTPFLSNHEMEALEKMEALLEESRRELEAFDLFA